MKGIDVSAWQQNIDWEKAKAAGVEFAILRLGYIGNNENVLDNYFIRNYNECKRLNIPIGIYVYNYVKTPERVVVCANWVIEQLKGKNIELPIYLDMEDSSIASQGKTILTNICIAFNTVIEKSGYWAGVYANLNWFNNYLNKEEIKRRYTTWIAHFGASQEKYRGQYDMLQYSSGGSINGISGRTDLNIMYRDLLLKINPKKSITLEEKIKFIESEIPDFDIQNTIDILYERLKK